MVTELLILVGRSSVGYPVLPIYLDNVRGSSSNIPSKDIMPQEIVKNFAA